MDENSPTIGTSPQTSGPIISIIIIIVLLVAGGVYVFLNRETPEEQNINIDLGTTIINNQVEATTTVATTTASSTQPE